MQRMEIIFAVKKGNQARIKEQLLKMGCRRVVYEKTDVSNELSGKVKLNIDLRKEVETFLYQDKSTVPLAFKL